MVQSRNHVKKFVNFRNAKDLNILFTFKIEDQNNFSFLEIKIIRNTRKNHLKHQFYSICTYSGVFTNFKKFIPITYKFGLLETLVFPRFSICPSYEKFHEEIVHLTLKKLVGRGGQFDPSVIFPKMCFSEKESSPGFL